jgi:tRNA dimethylallyltransferase
MMLARAFHGMILSADSRQIYRRFDIGTAKPTKELHEVPHRGIDIVDPTERYSAAQWAEDAGRWIDEAKGMARIPIVVGGTGLYIRSLFEPLFESPPLDPEKRAELHKQFAEMCTNDLRNWCIRLDPERAHLGRTQLMRAIETKELTGRKISELHKEQKTENGKRITQNARYLVLDPGATLGKMIEHRTDQMLNSGWEEEVRQLMADLPHDAPAWKASGYRVMREVVKGDMELSAARSRIIIETRQYAKRQRTWFRHQLQGDVTKLNPLDPEFNSQLEHWWARES